eukprot:gnl/MRDRNA2_/MRDRNA2_157459_c0_seq1.p1 gnl/MRDRNA2_/MRDRNA2_157459_c0~~gnl/MRDRNA2_/MRDRNA2_157459_c0_seq1.p1  ORF type:complete len:498 (+),score=111.56 gnl/MRDRNA2_/MRDRNA2_157459_c0_seq1:91-1494(+)
MAPVRNAGFRNSAARAASPTAPLGIEDKAPAPVGLSEDRYFKLDESVPFWENLQRSSSGSAIENIREATSIMTSIAAKGPEGFQYAVTHGVLRMGYFATNAVLGTLAFVANNGLGIFPKLQNEAEESIAGAEEGDLAARAMKDPAMAVDLLSLLLLESALAFQQDFRAISQGFYKAPWDMTTPDHRQNTLPYAAQQTLRFIDEAIGTLGRGADQKEPGIWLKSDFYPGYYKNDFHYQTDGWMSQRSADVYETATEVVFLGRQDAMQRLSLLPLRAMAAANNGRPRILEVACGTGRFATFIRDNHPTADVTLSDLSPFYLAAARENDDYWRKMRYPNAAARPAPATFVQAAAEALPFEDASFDAVVCVYLFHEMPEAARAAAAAEMARVVAPGGMVVLTDSMQRGDRFLLTSTAAKAFGKLNEPHVENYVDTEIAPLFTSRGLTPDGKWLESVTKTLSFRKPADLDSE